VAVGISSLEVVPFLLVSGTCRNGATSDDK